MNTINPADYLGLVFRIAQKTHRRLVRHGLAGRVPYGDLIGPGYLALADCAETFDPTRGTKFTTYAYWPVESRINEAADFLLSGHATRRYRYWRKKGEPLPTIFSLNAAPRDDDGPFFDVVPDTTAAEVEMSLLWHFALRRLPGPIRPACEACWRQELSASEYGRQCGIDKSQVAVWLKKSRHKLRPLVRDLFERSGLTL